MCPAHVRLVSELKEARRPGYYRRWGLWWRVQLPLGYCAKGRAAARMRSATGSGVGSGLAARLWTKGRAAAGMRLGVEGVVAARLVD